MLDGVLTKGSAAGFNRVLLVEIGTFADGSPAYGIATVGSGAAVAGEAHIGAIGGHKVSRTITFTRPTNTNAYAAKGVVAPGTLAVTAATNATPIVVTTGVVLHGLADGDTVTISGVVGNTAANGSFYAKVTGYSTTTFALYSDKALTTPVAGNGAWTSGGTVVRILRFADMGRVVNGTGYVVKATILTTMTALTEAFKLHLYSSPPAPLADNAVCTAPLFADAGKYIGTIVFPALVVEGTGADAAYANMTPNTSSSNLPLAFGCAVGDRDIYPVLETPAGFTPANGQQFSIKLSIEGD